MLSGKGLIGSWLGAGLAGWLAGSWRLIAGTGLAGGLGLGWCPGWGQEAGDLAIHLQRVTRVWRLAGGWRVAAGNWWLKAQGQGLGRLVGLGSRGFLVG